MIPLEMLVLKLWCPYSPKPNSAEMPEAEGSYLYTCINSICGKYTFAYCHPIRSAENGSQSGTRYFIVSEKTDNLVHTPICPAAISIRCLSIWSQSLVEDQARQRKSRLHEEQAELYLCTRDSHSFKTIWSRTIVELTPRRPHQQSQARGLCEGLY